MTLDSSAQPRIRFFLKVENWAWPRRGRARAPRKAGRGVTGWGPWRLLAADLGGAQKRVAMGTRSMGVCSAAGSEIGGGLEVSPAGADRWVAGLRTSRPALEPDCPLIRPRPCSTCTLERSRSCMNAGLAHSERMLVVGSAQAGAHERGPNPKAQVACRPWPA